MGAAAVGWCGCWSDAFDFDGDDAAAVSICNESRGSASANAIQQRTGLDEREVQASLAALASEQPPFFENLDTRSGYVIAGVLGPTGHARRMVQQWPNPEDKLRELIRVLELAADKEPDPATASLWRRAAAQAGGFSRELFISVLSGAVTGG